MREALRESRKSIVHACPNPWSEVAARWNAKFEGVFSKEQWRKSSQFFMLRRSHADLIAREEKIFNAFSSVPFGSNEHYVPTTLAYYGKDQQTSCSEGFVWNRFNKRGSHPLTFDSYQIKTGLFHELANADRLTSPKECSAGFKLCHFTARKFLPSTRFRLLAHSDYVFSDKSRPLEQQRIPRVVWPTIIVAAQTNASKVIFIYIRLASTAAFVLSFYHSLFLLTSFLLVSGPD
jgi:hypothetical protein